MKILSKSNVTIEQAKDWAKERNATSLFIALADNYKKICDEYGVNFSIAYCQFAKETGYGKFTGVLNESYCNPCGLKNHGGGGDKDPNAHHRFNNWNQGITAQIQHLCLYAGKQGYPLNNPIDPRHFSSICGSCPNVEDLGGKWATGKNYGYDIINLVNSLESHKIKPSEEFSELLKTCKDLSNTIKTYKNSIEETINEFDSKINSLL